MNHPNLYTFQIGRISVPFSIQSEDEAEHSSYDNPGLGTALSNAYPKVLEVVTGILPHPIMEFVKNATMELPGTKIDQVVNFHHSHPVPILPSDATLITPYLQKLVGKVGVVPNKDILVFGIAKVLFELVVVRSYLGLTLAHDAHIYEAWSQKLLHHRFTPEERALEACRTNRVLINEKIVPQTPSRLPRTGFKVIYSNIPPAHSFIVDHGPIIWEERPQHSLGTDQPLPLCPLPTRRTKRKLSKSSLEDGSLIPAQAAHKKQKQRVW